MRNALSLDDWRAAGGWVPSTSVYFVKFHKDVGKAHRFAKISPASSNGYRLGARD
jgi:hypothetical protein